MASRDRQGAKSRQGGNRSGRAPRRGTAASGGTKLARGGGSAGKRRGPRKSRPGVASNKRRFGIGRILLVLALVSAGVKLVVIQGFEASALSERADDQLLTKTTIPAQRGSILDSEGRVLAFSSESRKLYANPRLLDQQQREAENPEALPGPEKKREIAAYIGKVTNGRVSEQETLRALFSGEQFLYFGSLIDPAVARKIHDKYPQIGTEYRAVRQYPAGSVGAGIVGSASWRKGKNEILGNVGLESSLDSALSGEDGLRISHTAHGSTGLVIPGTKRTIRPAEPGSDVRLTIDSDLQFVLDSKLDSYVREVGAEGGSAVVLDSRTGEVRALANSDPSVDPSQGSRASRHLSNPAVTTPYEPGSVNKVITAAGAIEHGIMRPDSVLRVPSKIEMGGATVRDAWQHGTLPLTFTGVLAKSSNVGTLMTAKKLGKERFGELVRKFGLGSKTGIALPGESSGVVPPSKQWSDTRFANLPIGQGLSMTVLQMAGMYQAIANDGVRIPPRVVDSTIGPNGQEHQRPDPEGVRVVSERTADTVKNMLRAVVQDEQGQRGTAPQAALAGYQVSGKTGTAQQPDPECGCYSNSQHWATFAGMLPADNPRYVIGIMLDNPDRGNLTAAPLFHDVAADLTRRYDIPLSAEPAPEMTLRVR
ncbi:peptidoglycan D,D-transpeptidase FtsI family protein [Actinopolyspora sp. H202]